MNKQQLAKKIWESANKMRSKIEASEYKDYILGFIFYKFLSDREEDFLLKNDFAEEDIKSVNEEDAEIVEFVQSGLVYFMKTYFQHGLVKDMILILQMYVMLYLHSVV